MKNRIVKKILRIILLTIVGAAVIGTLMEEGATGNNRL